MEKMVKKGDKLLFLLFLSLRATMGSVVIRRCERSVAISSYKDEIAQPVPSKAKESSSLLAMILE
jgi:hypothetical protein